MNAALQTIEEKVQQLSPQKQAEVVDFVDFLLSKEKRKRHIPKFDWVDEQDDPPETYSSVELQHLATQLMVEKNEKNLLPRLSVLQIGEGIVLIPDQPLLAKLRDRIAQVFTNHQMTAEEVMAGLPEAREQIFARLYPQLAANKPTRKPARKKAK